MDRGLMFSSIGTIRYETKDEGYRLSVEIDQQIADYYRALVPFWKPITRQRYGAHITVVRIGKEVPVNIEHWGKYDGEQVPFFYEPCVYEGTVYYWLNVWCVRLEEIRKELGLPVTSLYTLPPEGFVKCFHCTIGNKK